ncbi:MAG: hypothetical protein PHY43_07370 [Verrucomicrobiales bacterium]|nr:hypothetical protein [Verrucomicrobiales bacterium]
MKKYFLVFIAAACVCVVYLIWHYERERVATAPSLKNASSNSTKVAASPVTTTVLTAIVSTQAVFGMSQTNTSSLDSTAIVQIESLADLKEKIASLKLLEADKYDQVWVSDGIPLVFEIKGKNDKAIRFVADFVEATSDPEGGRIWKLELHSPNMSIEELRPLGIQLHEMLKIDPQPFLSWADKVGNAWVDSPLYYNGEPAVPAGEKRFSFGVLHTYNDERPWFVRFLITSR